MTLSVKGTHLETFILKDWCPTVTTNERAVTFDRYAHLLYLFWVPRKCSLIVPGAICRLTQE